MLPKTAFRLDPFLLALAGSLILATVLPVHGQGARAFYWLTNAAIFLLFFTQGARLSRDAVLRGLGNWPLHALVLASNFVLFPIAGMIFFSGARFLVDPVLASGIIYLAVLPSTVQSAIAFTAIAGGNTPAAVCASSLSNVVGIIVSPLLAGLLMRVDGASGISLQAFGGIILQLLLPFVAGHLLRPWIGDFVERNRRYLLPVDRGSVLLVVYGAFSAAVVNGIWQRLDPISLLYVLLICAGLLAVILALNVLMARRAGLPLEDRIVLLFCGSKKSLVSGVPIASALFAPREVGMIILPLMIFHQLQLFACALLAVRYRRAGVAADDAGRANADRPALSQQS